MRMVTEWAWHVEIGELLHVREFSCGSLSVERSELGVYAGC